jgi:hemerythrin-like domain-containing protein
MTDLLHQLEDQHEDLRLALRLLVSLADRAAAGACLPNADCAVVLTFLRDFAFGVHMPLEQKTVLASLAAHGSEDDVQCVGQVLRTQDEAQGLLHCLRVLWEPSGPLTASECEGLCATARALDRMLTRCMRVEEDRLFRSAKRAPADDRVGWPHSAAESHPTAAKWRQALQDVARRWT